MGFSWERSTAVGGSQSVEKNMNGANRLLVVQTVASASQAKVFKADAVPQGVCENLINALKRCANQQKDGTGQSFELRRQFVLSWILDPRPVVELVFNGLWPRGLRHGTRDVDQAFVGRCFGPVWILGTVCFCAQPPTHWNVPKKYGPHGELFFFLLKKEPTVFSELVEFGPYFSAETVKAYALMCLHMVAEETALLSDSDSSP